MEKTIKVQEKYIYFPIDPHAEEKYLEIFDGHSKIFEFKVPAGSSENHRYYAKLPVEGYIGRELRLIGDFPLFFFDGIKDKYTEKQENRPLIHFTPDAGWINDPNGLVYDGKTYHMYFQYNPFNISWQNMSWGHAISQDLLHWEELDPALFPDEDGTIFSGSGYKNGDELLFFYTSAGGESSWSQNKDFVQKLAISTDRGQTLVKQKQPVVGKIGKDSRDPKVFWHEESQAYIMALYIQEDEFAILRSQDMREWTLTQRFRLQEAWECPNLLRITEEENPKNHKWLFWSADGFYFWGDFDGYTFSTDGKRHCAYLGKEQYAAQTYSGVSDRVINVSWLRLENQGERYTGAMGIPRELTYRKVGEEYYLLQKPIREFSDQLEKVDKIPSHGPYTIQLSLAKAGVAKMKINGSQLIIDKKELAIDEQKYHCPIDGGSIEIIVDHNIIEVGLSDDIKVGVYKLKGHKNEFVYDISEGASIQIFSLKGESK